MAQQWPSDLKDRVQAAVGNRGMTAFTVDAVEAHLDKVDLVTELRKQLHEARSFAEVAVDVIANMKDYPDVAQLLRMLDAPDWVDRSGWPGFVEDVHPKLDLDEAGGDVDLMPYADDAPAEPETEPEEKSVTPQETEPDDPDGPFAPPPVIKLHCGHFYSRVQAAGKLILHCPACGERSDPVGDRLPDAPSSTQDEQRAHQERVRQSNEKIREKAFARLEEQRERLDAVKAAVPGLVVASEIRSSTGVAEPEPTPEPEPGMSRDPLLGGWTLDEEPEPEPESEQASSDACPTCFAPMIGNECFACAF